MSIDGETREVMINWWMKKNKNVRFDSRTIGLIVRCTVIVHNTNVLLQNANIHKKIAISDN